MSRTHWHLRMIRSQERGSSVLWSPGTMPLSPGTACPALSCHLLIGRMSSYLHWKPTAGARLPVKAGGPRTQWLFTCRAFVPENLIWCSVWDAVHSQVIRHGVQQGNCRTPIPRNHREVGCAVCNGARRKAIVEVLLPAHKLETQAALKKETVFEIYFIFQSSGPSNLEGFALLC